ncbi:MAG: hypothetical protein U0235_29840 [Polyangiaceae bacterium]
MIREDLLALTPEAMAALANVGLVKRAQREIAEGKGRRWRSTTAARHRNVRRQRRRQARPQEGAP